DVEGEGDRGVGRGGGESDPFDVAGVGELERRGLAGELNGVPGRHQVPRAEAGPGAGVEGDRAGEGDLAGARVGGFQVPGAFVEAQVVAFGRAGGGPGQA